MDRNQGYTILKAVMLENGRGFALGEHPRAPSPFVTWACYDDEHGARQYEWGHYGSDRAALEQDLLDGYVELMLEICCSTRQSVRICGQEVPTEVVKSRFLKLNSEHIGYVMDSLKSNTAKIGNIKAYTLAALYNAPVTMGQYYTSLVSHDMAHGLLDG